MARSLNPDRRYLFAIDGAKALRAGIERVFGERAGDHAPSWTATGLLEAERKFRRVKGYRELEILRRHLNPSLTHQDEVA